MIYPAKALLSRVYLSAGQYDLAEQAATEVINRGPFSLPADYIVNWGAISSSTATDEIIWTLQYIAQDGNNLGFVAFQ